MTGPRADAGTRRSHVTTAGTLIVLAKQPRPGLVKTRLQTEFTPAEAASLARAALTDTLTAVAEAPVRRKVLALDGEPGPWLPSRFTVVPQRGDGLDERLAHAFEDAYDGSPMLLIGMDTPQVTPALLDVDWSDHDAVLGLTEDGGFWCLGLPAPDDRALIGVPMSTDHTGAEQLARLRTLGYQVKLLPTLRDMDAPVDAAVIAAAYPHLRVSQLHTKLRHGAQSTLVFEQVRDQEAPVAATGTDGMLVAAREVARWCAPADAADRLALSRCEAPVLDLGCGPGRLVAALAEQGVAALGVDLSEHAVLLATQRGASALRRSIDSVLPGEGRWGSVLLMDGNIGIGARPEALLRRCAELVRPDGVVLVEVDPDDTMDDVHPTTLRALTGPSPMAWARLGGQAVLRHAQTAGLHPIDNWHTSGRAFVSFRRAA